mgnify:CR=1 FL=1
MTLLFDFIPTMRVCVRELILLQFIADILWILLLVIFKAFSNAIFNFDSYGISIGFGGNNSKTFDDGDFNSFEDGVAEL